MVNAKMTYNCIANNTRGIVIAINIEYCRQLKCYLLLVGLVYCFFFSSLHLVSPLWILRWRFYLAARIFFFLEFSLCLWYATKWFMWWFPSFSWLSAFLSVVISAMLAADRKSEKKRLRSWKMLWKHFQSHLLVTINQTLIRHTDQSSSRS